MMGKSASWVRAMGVAVDCKQSLSPCRGEGKGGRTIEAIVIIITKRQVLGPHATGPQDAHGDGAHMVTDGARTAL